MVLVFQFFQVEVVTPGARRGPAPSTSALTGDVRRLPRVLGGADIACWPSVFEEGE